MERLPSSLAGVTGAATRADRPRALRPRPLGAPFAVVVVALVVGLAVLLAPVLPGGAGAADAAAAADPAVPPLDVELTSVTPGAIPRKGPIVLEGIVRNTSTEPWTGLNVYPLTSSSPMTDRTQVEEAALSDPDTTAIGERIVADGSSIGDLAPGASSTFRVRLKQRDLRISGAPGVYWIGVHVLGANAAGRDLVADGRARTFIPLVPPDRNAQVSLVVPLRRAVRYAEDGTLLRATDVAQALAADGRLGRIAALGKQAGARPVSWLVDPAVLDAARAIAEDNPPLDLAKASRRTRPTPTPSPTSGANGAPAADLTDADRDTAKDWLTTVTGLARSGTTLALPYADPDVSAVARTRPTLLGRARALGRQVLEAQQITSVPALAPPDGYLDPAVVGRLGDADGGGDLTVLLSDHGRPVDQTVQSSAGRRFVYTDARTAEGGPRPYPRVTALSMRQRILADAALVALGPDPQPLVVQLPTSWDPGPDWRASDFFGGLDQPWLTLAPLPSGTPTDEPAVSEPLAAHRQEVPAANVAVAEELARTARVVGTALDTTEAAAAAPGTSPDANPTPGPDTPGLAQASRLAGAALGAVSYHARTDPALARARTEALSRTVSGLLDRVRVVGTDFVTLSGTSGVLTVSLVNGLDKPIRVGLRASTGGGDVRIEDVPPVRLAAGQRSTVRLQAHAEGTGLHRVRLSPVTADGARFGDPLLFNLRTSQVGRVFWGVLIACGVVLLVAVARRVTHRLRAHQWRA